MRRRNVDMLEGDLFINILLFALPVTASGIIQLLFNAVDMIVVGQFSGSSSMAAVSSTSSLISLITNLFIGLSVGSSVCIARRIGSGDYEKISDAVQTSITLALIFGIILMGFGIVFSRTLLEMMKSPVDVIDLSTLYLRVYFTGMPATMVYNFASAVLRAKGDTKRPLLALTISGVLNALPAYVSAIIVVIVLVTDPGFTRFDPRHLYIEKGAFADIARVGIPAGIQSTVFSISNVVIQSSINSFGSAAMAGNGAGSSISNFIYSGMNSFYQTCLTFTSQNVGAGKIDRVKKILILCLLDVAVTGIVLGWAAVFFGEQLLSLYTHDPEVVWYGMIRLRYICIPYFIYGMMDVLVGSLRGMGSSVAPMIVSLLGVCAFRLLWVYTYFQVHNTFEDLFLSYPVSWIIEKLKKKIISL